MLRAISASQGCRVSSKGWFRLRRHWNWKAVLAIAQQGKFVPELPPASLGQAPFLRCFNQGPTLQFWLDLIQAEFLFLFSVVLALLNQVQGISFSWNAYRVFLKVSVFVSAKKKKENQNKKKETSGCSTVSLSTGELTTGEVNNLCCQGIARFDIFKGNKIKLRS